MKTIKINMQRVKDKELKQYRCDSCNIEFESDEYRIEIINGEQYEIDQCPVCKGEIKVLQT